MELRVIVFHFEFDSIVHTRVVFVQAVSKRQWRLIEVNAELDVLEASRQRILELLCPSEMVMDFNIGAVMLLGARAQGAAQCAEAVQQATVILYDFIDEAFALLFHLDFFLS